MRSSKVPNLNLIWAISGRVLIIAMIIQLLHKTLFNRTTVQVLFGTNSGVRCVWRFRGIARFTLDKQCKIHHNRFAVEWVFKQLIIVIRSHVMSAVFFMNGRFVREVWRCSYLCRVVEKTGVTDRTINSSSYFFLWYTEAQSPAANGRKSDVFACNSATSWRQKCLLKLE